VKTYPSRLLCLIAWAVAAAVQLIVVLRTPGTIIVSGVDISHENNMVLAHQAIFIGCGLALSVAAFVRRGWAAFLVVTSAAMYLIHWFPFQPVYKYGLTAVAKSMFILGSNPILQLSSVTRDVILPIAFIVVIVLTVLEMRRSRTWSSA